PHRRARAERTTANWVFVGFLIAFALEYSGLPNGYPILKQLRLTTLITYAMLLVTISQVGFGDLLKHRQTRLLVTLLIFTAASVMWAVVKQRAFDNIRPFVDYLILFYLAANLIDRPKRFQAFGIMLVMVIVYLVSQNLARMGQEVRAGAFAAPYFMGDGNDFAWGLAMMIPFCLYLVTASKGVFVRIVGLVGLLVALFGVIGTSSRGGSLGVIAAILFYWWFMSGKKALGIAIMVVGLIAVLAFAPASYLNRMGGLSNTSDDTSAQARLTTWKASLKMAVDYPLGVGAGNFSSAYGRFYLGSSGKLGYASNKWFSAHSIYFRTLGEYGYLGVGLLIWLIISSIVANMKVRAKLIEQGSDAKIPVAWPSVVAMSLVAFAVCGTFLGGLSYPHLFLLCGLTVANKRFVGLVEGDAQVGRGRGRKRATPAPRAAGAES
ncbi:MAG TPA: O-antigen ligase family protein, partial [Burkholderiaceae bacterium]